MDKAEKIRQRNSYKRYANLYDKLVRQGTRNPKHIIRAVHDMIDCMRGYSYETASYYAKGSIKQLIKDRRQ